MKIELSITRSIVHSVLACGRGRLASWRRGVARRQLRRVRMRRLRVV